MASPDERVAALEAHRENDVKLLTEMSGKLDTVVSKVTTIELQLAKQKGFLAGVMFVLLPIWSAITVAVSTYWDKWTGQGQ
jgi:hypothetical protein